MSFEDVLELEKIDVFKTILIAVEKGMECTIFDEVHTVYTEAVTFLEENK